MKEKEFQPQKLFFSIFFKVRRDCQFCALKKVGEEKRKLFLVRESVCVCRREFLLPPPENLGRFVYGGLRQKMFLKYVLKIEFYLNGKIFLSIGVR